MISAVEAVAQSSMQQTLRQYQQRLHYWIAPTAEGKITTYQYYTGKKQLHAFYLMLPELWSPNKVPSKKMEEQDHQLLPEKTPLLIAEPVNYEQLLWAQTPSANSPTENLFMLANHGHILRCQQGKTLSNPSEVKGWKWVYRGLADYTAVEIGRLRSGDFVLLLSMRAPRRLDWINLTQRTKVTVNLPDDLPEATKGNRWYLKRLVYKDDSFYALDNKDGAWRVKVQASAVLEPYADVAKIQSLYDAHTQFLAKAKTNTPTSRHYQILRNIHVLSEQGHLLINGRHQLQLSQRGIVKIGSRTSPTIVSARLDYKRKRLRHFTFPDGSTVITNSLGLMVLTSSNDQLPSIYLPTALNKPIGMATQEHFCGNQYYYKGKTPSISDVVTPKFFFTLYLKPFIDTIVGSLARTE